MKYFTYYEKKKQILESAEEEGGLIGRKITMFDLSLLIINNIWVNIINWKQK